MHMFINIDPSEFYIVKKVLFGLNLKPLGTAFLITGDIDRGFPD